jgi:hypothetical protein
MNRLFFVVVALAVTACGDNRAAPTDPPMADAGVDASPDKPAALAPCLERPTDLSTAPIGALPCELLPPGFQP